jgi:NTE family protein
MIFDTLVLSAGGFRGITLIGALKILEEKKILRNVTTIIGTSAGSLTGSLLTLGYKPSQMLKISLGTNFLKNIKMGLSIHDIMNLSTMYGAIDSAKKLKKIIQILIKNSPVAKGKPNITLRQLYKLSNQTLILCTTSLTSTSAQYLSYKTHPDMKLEEAIRASCAIPLVFAPVNNMFIDGAVVDNYPFEQSLNYDKTIGIVILDKTDTPPIIFNIFQYIKILIKCVETNRTEWVLNNKKIKNNSIIINCARTHNLSKNELYDIGVETTKTFFKKRLSKSNIITKEFKKKLSKLYRIRSLFYNSHVGINLKNS